MDSIWFSWRADWCGPALGLMGIVVPIEVYFWLWREKWVKGSHRIVSKVVEVRMALTCQLCSFLFSLAEKMFLIRLLLCRTKFRNLISLIFRGYLRLFTSSFLIVWNDLHIFVMHINVSPKMNTSMIIPTIPVVFPVIISDEVNAVWNEKSLCGKQNLIASFMCCQVLFLFTLFLQLTLFSEKIQFFDFVCLSFYNSYIFMNSVVLFCFFALCIGHAYVSARESREREREGCCINPDLVSETSFFSV